MAERTDRQAQTDPWDAAMEALKRLARDIGTVDDIAGRRSDPDRDHQQMRARLRAWRVEILKALDILEARPQSDAAGIARTANALLRERDAQIASMGQNQLVLQEAVATQGDLIASLTERVTNQSDDLVDAESERDTLRAERDAAQQERDGWRKAFGIQTTSGWTTPEAMKERHDDAWRRYQERGTALQQENKTLREALEEVTEHLESQRDIQLNNGYLEEYAAIGKARAALSSSPRPQEPQP